MLAEYGIYINCHISGTEEREVADMEEAARVAEDMEREIAEKNPDADDVWVRLEEVYE